MGISQDTLYRLTSEARVNQSSSEYKNRKKIFALADYLLVHTENSINELQMVFAMPIEKIVKHPFPIMDLTKLSKDEESKYTKADFLFIGHLRLAKGIQLLLDAWPEVHRLIPQAKLRICGQRLAGLQMDQEVLEKMNVEFNLHFINDEDYYHYVKAARFVLLPYLEGTNSGIISTVLSLGAEVITSDIPMFAENPLVSKENMFRSGDAQSLVALLQKKYESKESKAANQLNQYRSEFTDQVLAAYRLMLE